MAKCSSKAILFLNLLLRRRERGAGSRQNKPLRFAGVDARRWLPQGEPGQDNRAGLGARLDRNRRVWTPRLPKRCRTKRLCCHEIDQALRRRYGESLIKKRPTNGLGGTEAI